MNFTVIIVVCVLLSCVLQDINSKSLRQKKPKKKPKPKTLPTKKTTVPMKPDNKFQDLSMKPEKKFQDLSLKPYKAEEKPDPVEKLEEDVGPVEWNPIANAVNMRWRIIQLGRAICDDAAHKMLKHNKTRVNHERTPYYEIGYVFSEIVEKYRKLVEVVRRSQVSREDMFRTVAHLETAQSLYFQLFHLVNMLHEIPRKYFKNPKYQDLVLRIEGLYLMDDFEEMLGSGKKKTGNYYKRIEDMMEEIRQKRLDKIKYKLWSKYGNDWNKREEEMKRMEEEMKKRYRERLKRKKRPLQWSEGSYTVPSRPRRPGSGRWVNHTYGWEPSDMMGTYFNVTHFGIYGL